MNQLIRVIIADVYSSGVGVLSISIAATVWSSAMGFASLIRGLEDIYEQPRRAGFLMRRARGIIYTLGMLLMMILSFVLGGFGQQIKALVAEYYHDFKEKKADFKPGDRVTYASRVFDEKEMCALTDATLDFWLTTGRFADEFEKEFAKWIGVKFANLVNSGSSANLIAFMALTAPELGDRQIKKGDEIITVACGFPTTVTPAL